jgi:hypothetical protein
MTGELFPAILTKKDVGDWIFPSSNAQGVPDLNPRLQPLGLEAPVNRWGAKARKNRVEGQTIHFYTDDYRFTGLWKDPTQIINSGARAMAECNFSTNSEMPESVVQAYIYMKRWISTWAQKQGGLEIWVDVAIDKRWHDIALLGVPRGWKSYSTYTYITSYDPEEWLIPQYEMCVNHAGDEHINFWVYGGEEEVQKLCLEHGWLWTPAHQQAYLRNVGGNKVRVPKTLKQLEKTVKIEEPKYKTLEMFC